MSEPTPTTPSSSSASPPVLDVGALEALGQIVGEVDPTLVRDIVATFLTEGRARVEVLEEALGTGDHETSRSAAHALKSSSAHIGARRLFGICAAVEQLVTDGRLAEAGARVGEARAAFDAVAAELGELFP